MKRLKDYKYTFNSCCIGSGIQAIGISLPPLLFVSFQDSFNISVTQLTALVTLTFLVQLAIDAASAKFIDKIGYRATAITSHAFVFVGLILTGVLPYTLSSPYVGLIIGTIFTSIGCGLIEVVISPLVEAIPDKKAGKMSLLHSCYCFGYLFVVLISVIYFVIFDRNSWQFLVFGFAAIPLLNGIFFFFVPCTSLDEQRGADVSIRIAYSLRGSLRTGYVSMGILFCRKKPQSQQSHRRPCRSVQLCVADGIGQIILWTFRL